MVDYTTHFEMLCEEIAKLKLVLLFNLQLKTLMVASDYMSSGDYEAEIAKFREDLNKVNLL